MKLDTTNSILIRKKAEKERRTDETNSKMVDSSPSILIIILNINVLNTPCKRQRYLDCIKSKIFL